MVTVNSRTASLLCIEAKDFILALDPQTLQYFGSVAGFTADHNERRTYTTGAVEGEGVEDDGPPAAAGGDMPAAPGGSPAAMPGGRTQPAASAVGGSPGEIRTL